MELRKRLTLLFLALIASIIIISSIIIYFWFSEYRQSEFYERMSKKAHSVAELLIDVDEVDVKLLKKIENTKPVLLSDENIIIYNYKNEIIYQNPHNSFVVSPDKLDKIRLDQDIEYKENGNEVLGFYYKGRYDRAVVAISAKDTYGLSKLAKLRVILISVSVFSIVLVYFSGLFFVGKALNPVASIIKQVDSISISNINQRLNEGNQKDDLAQLAITFNKMLDRLELSFGLQKVFIANASHELRTPLTVMTSQLEVALLKKRSSEEYYSILNSVLEDINNVNQIANKLLLIAQVSSDFVNVELSKIRIDDVIWNVRQECRKRYPGYIINVSFDKTIENDTFFNVLGNEVLLKAAFTNLIENACKYTDDRTVEIKLCKGDNGVKLLFIDKGIGIEPSEVGLIFEPFFRGKNTLGIKGHGIGLPLVNNIIKLHKGQIAVMSEIKKGTTFEIILPLFNS